MTDTQQEEPTFNGFKRSDFGYDPEYAKQFDVPFKAIDVENLQPDPAILAEYQELFGPDGYMERSAYVDALGGSPTMGTKQGILLMAQRRMAGIKLPSTQDTGALMLKVHRDSSHG